MESLADGLAIPEIRLSDPVVYFPVRHHSPACAFHLRGVIERIRPSEVLIEGPADAGEKFIPLLADPEAEMPLALFATCVRPRRGGLPDRFGAYYPFCDYSPELVAIREGLGAGAEVRFIDLDYPSMVAAEDDPEPARSRNLLEETYLRRSALIAAACRRSGARDHDDLWDSLFETSAREKDPERFIREVLAYCALARFDARDEELEAAGTHHREWAMAEEVRSAMKRSKKGAGPILVVTGGYHTLVLPSLVESPPRKPPVRPAPAGEGSVQLIRYGFPQLDRLNGYGSGMPSPDFYQRSWQTLDRPETVMENAADWIVRLARELRERKLPVSPADEIACLDQVNRLAALRGHSIPSREDLLDGIRSVFVKGEHDVEGLHILAQARKLLCGSRTGKVPAGAGTSPLVADFQALAAQLQLDLDAIERRELVLDLYRRTRHRQASRMLYRLRFLEVTFAQLLRGPDFATGEDLGRIRETWSYLWEPATEAGLVEARLFGATLEEAAINRLREEFGRETTRSASLATRLIIEGCRMGLHREAGEIVASTSRILREDPDFASLVEGLGHLLTLQVSSEPLEAHRLDGLDGMAEQAYEMACYRLPDLVNASAERSGELVAPLQDLVSFSESLDLGEIERDWLRRALQSLDAEPSADSRLHGAASGLLFSTGQWTEDQLADRLGGYLEAATADRAEGARYVEGLLQVARDVIWNVPAVIRKLDAFFREIDETTFLTVVPHLRLAFSSLTAREIDRVARSARELGDLPEQEARRAWHSSFTSNDLAIAARIEHGVAGILTADRLREIVEEAENVPEHPSS